MKRTSISLSILVIAMIYCLVLTGQNSMNYPLLDDEEYPSSQSGPRFPYPVLINDIIPPEADSPESSFSYSETGMLAPADRLPFDWFGSPFVIGDEMMIGGMRRVTGCNSSDGAGYVNYYERNGSGVWEFRQKIQSPEPSYCDHFGVDMAIQGEWAFIGAWMDDNQYGTDAGKVYRFRKINGTWVHQPPDLFCPTPNSFDHFGVSVEIRDEYAFIGALGDNAGNGISSGTVFFYLVTAPGVLTYQSPIIPPAYLGADGNDNFGADIGYDDGTLVVSAYMDEGGGSAYSFERQAGTWICLQKFKGLDTQQGDGFGEGLDVDDGVLLVGAFFDDVGSTSNIGTVYAYTQDAAKQWVEVAMFRPTSALAEDYFGSRVCIDDGLAVIGAFRRDNGIQDGGAVYYYSVYKSYTLNYIAGPGGTISGQTVQTVNHGQNGTAVEAVPGSGYDFAGWSDGNTSNPRTEMNVTADLTVTADFSPTSPGFELHMRAYLEGPFNGTGMNTDLNPGTMPLGQPYNTSPWFYTGTESVATIPLNAVDWMLVEIRDAAAAQYATPSAMIARQAAFVLQNGVIVGLDGSSNLYFSNTIQNGLFVVLWHRNHLGIMSSSALGATGGVYMYDFSNAATKVYGGALGYREVAPGVWAMAGGDGNADGQINNGDKNDVWAMQAGTGGYLGGDYNMDAQVNNGDKNEIWAPNTGLGGQVPD
ncbi:MAG: hypothetical protein JW861_13735 [Bacteroidales bacterium]|nr:hypothetical protein [Bacteroidales bacterium]